MSNLPNRDDQHLQELICGRVLGDLSKEELQEFTELFSASHANDLQEFELAAAALQLALADALQPAMPDSLRHRIAAASVSFIVPVSDESVQFARSHRAESTASSAASRKSQLDDSDVGQRQSSRLTWREGVAWLAVAASLFLAAQLWFDSDLKKQRLTQVLTVTESRLALLNDSQNLIRVDWSDGKTPFESSVTGDVVWSNASQQGFMRFVGMPPNDPSREQYQLWIIDPERDAEPIDGGVFDIASTGEVVVPIQAKLKVLKAAAFAITVEKPGGVVVSTQDRLPLLAQVID